MKKDKNKADKTLKMIFMNNQMVRIIIIRDIMRDMMINNIKQVKMMPKMAYKSMIKMKMKIIYVDLMTNQKNYMIRGLNQV